MWQIFGENIGQIINQHNLVDNVLMPIYTQTNTNYEGIINMAIISLDLNCEI